MYRSQALRNAPSNADAAADLNTAVYFMPQALSDRTVPVAGLCRGRSRVHLMHKRLAAAILAVCVGVAFAGLARAAGGTTGANSGFPLWLPRTAYAPPPGPVHHRQRGHGHGHGWHRNYTIERYRKKYD
jgi:hypothetical protein